MTDPDQRWRNLADWYREQQEPPITFGRIVWWFALGAVVATFGVAVWQGRW